MSTYSEIQLDGLRELANIGSAQAAAALGTMLGHSVDISVPTAAALPLEKAIEVVGGYEEQRHAVLVPVIGDFDAHVLLLVPQDDAAVLCGVFGLDPHTDDGRSVLQELGNILGTSYINVLAQMCAMEIEPAPPQVVFDMLGAVLASVLLARGEDVETALLLDSRLSVEGQPCSLSFLMLPAAGGVEELLSRIGLA